MVQNKRESSSNLELQIEVARKTGLFVTDKHFGGNLKYSNTNSGVPTELFSNAAHEFGMNYVRIPAGEVGRLFEDGFLTKKGELTQPVQNILNWAKQHEKKVNLVTPIREPWEALGKTDSQRANKLQKLVSTVLSEFGDVIESFEIGNEFWSTMTEAEYGNVANSSILAIETAINELDLRHDPKILVQTANASGAASQFSQDHHEGSWGTRVSLANKTVLNKLSSKALKAVDGVVAHYYFDTDTGFFEMDTQQTSSISKELAVWMEELPNTPEVHITEWNVKSSHTDGLGMKAASTMLEQFEYMLRMGVDYAYVWPPVGNTRNKLVRETDKNVVLDGATGTVVNSINAAVFDRMEASLKGLELLETNLTDASSKIEVNTFASNSTAVIYLSSRSKSVESIKFEFAANTKKIASVKAVKIGYDKSSADGWFSTIGGADESIKTIGEFSKAISIEGQPHYVNEHDVKASITRSNGSDFFTTGGDKSKFSVSLLPYEVVEVTYALGTSSNIKGTSADDKLSGSKLSDKMYAKGGNDKVFGNGGDDRLAGAAGNDKHWGGQGDDVVNDRLGNNYVDGGAGNDTISLGRGRDTIEGNYGHDDISTGGGNDKAFAGPGNDRLFGNMGSDMLGGGKGEDILHGGKGNDRLNGGSGADIFVFKNFDGSDVILDFESGVDKIKMVAIANGFADLHISSDSGNAKVEFGAGEILVKGTPANELTSEDFIFG